MVNNTKVRLQVGQDQVPAEGDVLAPPVAGVQGQADISDF